MRKRGKRLFAITIVTALSLAIAPIVSAEESTKIVFQKDSVINKAEEEKEDVVIEEISDDNAELWEDAKALPTGGNYKLETDVLLAEELFLGEGDSLTLDLNGHQITSDGAEHMADLSETAILIMKDGSEEETGVIKGFSDTAIMLHDYSVG